VIAYRFIGEVSYGSGLELQAEAFAEVQRSDLRGVILGLTHHPVMTLGRNAGAGNLLLPRAQLEARGVEVVQTDRGGDVTYHGPEQVLLYPIVRIASVRDFACAIEKAMIAYLGTLGINARREDGAPGVFVGREKIGFLGLRVREGISTHGLSLNLAGSLEPFSWMNPCGFQGMAMTSVERLLGSAPSHASAAAGLAQQLTRLLEPAPNEDPRVSSQGSVP
jgi:lipoyl(octanoyl) transferase